MENSDKLIELYKAHKHEFERFLRSVVSYFELEPSLHESHLPAIHSIKSRLKDPDHLRDKLERKEKDGREINEENLFQEITDFAGMRILHLYQNQFPLIHASIISQIENGDWSFVEPPKAYTWDPESVKFFKDLGLEVFAKDSYYTSIHYLVKPNNNRSIVCCEIQVRTLFEEIWGEIDHTINYPHPTDSVACKEEIRVLAKLTSTGTRLADAIFKSYDDYKKANSPHFVSEG